MLTQVIENQEQLLSNFFSTFVVANNQDVQNYLIKTAIKHHKKHRTRTYLLCLIDETGIEIVAYYTIALYALSLPPENTDISNTTKQKLDGFNRKESIFPCYLIAQMGRNDKYNSAILSGTRLLEYAESTIIEITKSVGGRFIVLECLSDKTKLVSFYQNNSYEILQNKQNKNDQNMVQFYKMI